MNIQASLKRKKSMKFQTNLVDYKIIVVGLESSGKSSILNMIVNGNNVATKMGSNYGGYGVMMRTLRLKKFDTIVFNTNYHYGTDKLFSCFTVEKL